VKIRSFRRRIALLAATLAGSSLIGFGLIAWRLIYVAKVSRLEAKLEYLVKRTVRPREQDFWQSFEASLPGELEANLDTPIVVLVIGTDGKIIHQSENFATPFNLRRLLPPILPVASAFPSNQRPTSRNFLAKKPLSSSDIGTVPDPRMLYKHTTTGNWQIGVVSSIYAQGAIAVSLEAINQEMSVIGNIFLIVISGTLLLVAGGAWLLSNSALSSIEKLTIAIQQIKVTGLEHRVPMGTVDVEFVELVEVFNQMLERLERSFQQASRFSGDAAHELKTPLAILQGELERMMQQVELGSDLQQNLSNLLDEVNRLNGIIKKLLLLSLADAGQMRLHKVEVNVSEILAVIVEDVELLAPDLNIQADFPQELLVWGDRDLLNQVLQNLIANAIKYNLPNGWIRLQGYQHQKTIQITITNSSQDIPVIERDRIFDRFYRGDPARTRKIEGVGLGLSLSWEIAKAHQGELTLDQTPVGQTAFTLKLPNRLDALVETVILI
jgi:signal transduction histidine kinase